MHAVEKPSIAHDHDVLPLAQAERFRTWLVNQGVKVRLAKGAEAQKGKLFWARPKGYSSWVSVDMLHGPGVPRLATHKSLRPLINEFLKKPLTAAVKLASSACPPAAVRPQGANQAPQPVGKCATPCASPKCAGIDPAQPGADSSVATTFMGASVVDVQPVKRPPHLEDLRDDFALHAPLVQRKGEDLRAFAVRRWEYAELMMETRP